MVSTRHVARRVDLSRGHPCFNSCHVHAMVQDRVMAAAVAKRKEREYRAEVDAGCYEFWPAAVETSGRFGRSA